MQPAYNHSEIEKEVASWWEKEHTYETNPKSEISKAKHKMYCLSMFPYPSGAGLHVGHVRIFTGTDVMARYFRMKGYNVLHPMGWDAFGLPAENAAIKEHKNPMDMVPRNIANFKKQMQALGLSYDWDKEFSTTDPDYYKWTQWLFIQFFNAGLLYKKDTPINFCPSCKTGLAEEEVLPNGTHERCGKQIEKKDLPQWIFKITTYADALLKGLKELDWPQGILEMQKNWIGKKEGIDIDYPVKNQKEVITCFTTAPVNFGMTFIVLAPEHPIVSKIIRGEISVDASAQKNVEAYCKKTQKITDQDRLVEKREKTGVFTGLYATNRVGGWDVPVWIADFVLGHVGTGAVQGCPGHDYRDFAFAQKYNLPIIRVVSGEDGDISPITSARQIIVKGMKGKMVNSAFLNGLDFADGLQKTMDYVEENHWGKRSVSYHLRDWIFSRQRYWGEPIPMVFCQKCAENRIGNLKLEIRNSVDGMYGWFPVEDTSLPLELPYMKSYEPTGTGESPLSSATDWVHTTCPHCGGPAKRETDTMPNWAGSCWYFLRFAWNNEENSKPEIRNTKLISNAKSQSQNLFGTWNLEFRTSMENWLPVDWYLGGAEHAVLHLLYARFWMHVLHDLKLLPFKEPFLRLRNVGMVLAEDHKKMSKSLGNVVNPDDVIGLYGADAVRLYEMFMAPFNMEIAWSTTAILGTNRFVRRVYQLVTQNDKIAKDSKDTDKRLVSKLQRVIQKIEADVPSVKFNTSIAHLMEFINDWEAGGALPKEYCMQFIQLLAPFAPFVADYLWRKVFGEKKSIHLSMWPKVNEKVLQEEEIILPIQVNGKMRATITLSASQTEEKDVVQLALRNESVHNYVGDNTFKVIYVKGRILNFITN